MNHNFYFNENNSGFKDSKVSSYYGNMSIKKNYRSSKVDSRFTNVYM